MSRSQRTPTPTPPLLSSLESCPFSRGLIKKTGAIIKGRHAGHRKHFTRGTLRPSPVICEIGESTLNYTPAARFCLSFSPLSTADHGHWQRTTLYHRELKTRHQKIGRLTFFFSFIHVWNNGKYNVSVSRRAIGGIKLRGVVLFIWYLMGR